MFVNNTSAEYNLDKNSDNEGHKNVDIVDNESLVPDSDPDSTDIEASSVGSSEVCSDDTNFGDDNGANNDATFTANENIPNWKTNFTDITIEPFTKESGPFLPKTLMFLWQQH